jgi:VanZ family protein
MRGDELHQLWVQGRDGQWSDVLLDSSGVVFGIGLFMLSKACGNFSEKRQR